MHVKLWFFIKLFFNGDIEDLRKIKILKKKAFLGKILFDIISTTCFDNIFKT
jgi:hypothetical protein